MILQWSVARQQETEHTLTVTCKYNFIRLRFPAPAFHATSTASTAN